MSLSKRYNPKTSEPELAIQWQERGTYRFLSDSESPVYSIDTPPPTVSGHLHLGHVFSYSHADFVARFWRMNGYNVLYPMGYDDNGLPTERLVEQQLNLRARDVGRSSFIRACLEVSAAAEKDYEELWKRLGLSIDWRYTYRTIDDQTQRLSQLSFLDLYEKGLAYRRKSPTIWCPECQTAIAQAELDDKERPSEFVSIDFRFEDETALPIATTRPELLPACVAVFVHPDDPRYMTRHGELVRVPLFDQSVPILVDPEADPEKGTGAVMCCTFGDTADVSWWFTHELPLIEAIGQNGRMTEAAGILSGLPVEDARNQVKRLLGEQELLHDRQNTIQSVRVHERCDTPVEYVVTSQWFIRVLEFKEHLLAAGEEISWHPENMKARYRQWVENLAWDWCISRQRYYGVPFPVWHCDNCAEVIVARADELPVDPTEQKPSTECSCRNQSVRPETDVMDTWATSSLSPQIVGRWLKQGGFDGHPFDTLSLRPQAHEIIRTWAFYSIVKSFHHFQELPWKDVAISGWGLAAEGMGKISKSRGGGPISPMTMIEEHSADATRYWAASTGLGKDAIISEEKILSGAKLVTKLWNVARFSQQFIAEYEPPERAPAILSPADRWLLSRTQQTIARSSQLFLNYDYASAKSETEAYFWGDLADNYLEMAKQRLYEGEEEPRQGAIFTLYQALLTTVKLFAPFLPFVTEKIYLGLFAEQEGFESVHQSSWPRVQQQYVDAEAEAIGEILVDIATAVRRYKSTANISLGADLTMLSLTTEDPNLAEVLRLAEPDIVSITRAEKMSINSEQSMTLEPVLSNGPVELAIAR